MEHTTDRQSKPTVMGKRSYWRARWLPVHSLCGRAGIADTTPAVIAVLQSWEEELELFLPPCCPPLPASILCVGSTFLQRIKVGV